MELARKSKGAAKRGRVAVGGGGGGRRPKASGRVPQQARSKARVEAVLKNARRLIGRRGIGDVSMREIAVAARLPIASLYQYFPDKQAVLRALTVRFYDAMRERLSIALESLHGAEDLPAFLDAMVDVLVTELGAARPNLEVWAACQSSAQLRELDARDALALADLICARLRTIAPDLDAESTRDTVVFAVLMLGHVVRQSYALPVEESGRLVREFKRLLRGRAELGAPSERAVHSADGAASMTDPQFYDPAERAREKQASRDADARALATGEKTAEQLRAERNPFGFPHLRMNLDDVRSFE